MTVIEERELVVLDAEIESAVQAFAAAGAGNGLFYVSTPITTGRRELELMDELGVANREELYTHYKSRWLTEVFQANETEAAKYARVFGETVGLSHLVVNPAQFHGSPAWTQDEYDSLWGRLLTNFPATIAPVPGWAFSRGARVEISVGLRHGRQVVAADGSPRSVQSMLDECAAADAEIVARGWDRFGVSLPALDVSGPETGEPVDSEALAVTVFSWLSRERSYQIAKFGTDLDDKHTFEDALADDGWWSKQLRMYYTRARTLGLDEPSGRQALAKYVATGCGLLESVIRTKGWLPAPGVPSGDLKTDNQSA
ncbi:hypothetical protein ACXR2U_05215 [Jatrophihabitans sp. YIM 134969]